MKMIMYTDIHLVQFSIWREASTLHDSNANLPYLQVLVWAWPYLTAERGMLDVVETSLQLSALYHCLLFKASTNHSMASSSPVPLVAEVLNICHFLSFSAGKPSALAISVGVMACSMSCLFANTTKMAFFNSSSSSIATSSDFEVPILSRSQLSTT